MKTLQQSISTLALISLSSCTLENLVSNDSQKDTVQDKGSELISEASYSRRPRGCIPPAMTCSLTESTVSNEEYSRSD